MDNLKGFQKSYLRRKGHSLKPVIMIGAKGLSQAVRDAADRELENHEMIKVKFVDFKEGRREIAVDLAQQLEAQLVQTLGNTVLLYRYQRDPQKRIYHVPKRT